MNKKNLEVFKRRSKRNRPKFIGIYFHKQPLFVSIEVEVHENAGTVQNITDETVELKFQTKCGFEFVKGDIDAHGGKHFFQLCT